MSENENNQNMAAETAVNQSPDPLEGGGNGFGGGIDSREAVAEGDSGETLNPEEIADLKSKAARADENWDKYVRVTADLDNYRKRAVRERQEAVKYANEALIENLLPIVDNFEAALTAANVQQGQNVESLKTGINMIYTQLKSFLSDAGVEEIDATNKAFDPNVHEAVSQQPSDDVAEGQVLQQMRKGYRLRDRLIRPAMVVVAKKA